MNIQTYLFFDGCCEEAISFYRDVFDADQSFLMRFKDGPPELRTPENNDKIFHATLKFGETHLNMADAPSGDHTDFGGFALLAHVADAEEAELVFAALAQNGAIVMPLVKTFWAQRYGIVTDRFGVKWKIQVSG